MRTRHLRFYYTAGLLQNQDKAGFSACERGQFFTEAKCVDGFIEGLFEFLRLEMITYVFPCGEKAVAVAIEIRSGL